MKTKFILLSFLLILPSIFFAQVVDPIDPNAQDAAVAGETELDPFSFVLLEKEPLPLNMAEVTKSISYPKVSQTNQIQGKVVVKVLVDQEGNYVRHIVVKDPDSELTKAVTDQIHQLKFSPGIQNKKPITAWMTIPFNFELIE